jgi:TfoX/Sxy family transcriptional regulator of competence genes
VSTRRSTIDFVLDQMSALGDVRARKMFGEYAVYFADKVVALVCDDQLFVKMTPAGKAFVGERYEEGQAYPGAKPSILVSAGDIEDDERLCELVRVTAAALPQRGPRRRRGAGKERRSGTPVRPAS